MPSSDLSQINTPKGMLQANGDSNVVGRKTITTVTKDDKGNVISTTTTVEEIQGAQNALSVQHELDMRREDRIEAVGVAKASRPAYVPGYSGGYYGGGVTITTGGGHSYVATIPSGSNTSGVNSGTTVTTGSGGSSQVITNPSGPNTSGANPPGGVVVIGRGGVNLHENH